MKKLFTFISKTIIFIIQVVLICSIFLVLSTRVTDGEPNLLGYQLKTVLSGSMEPVISTGSVILVKQAKADESFHKGDIITYKTSDGILITHRIIEMKDGENAMITMGDNNNSPDLTPVQVEQVVSKYTGINVPYIGYVLQFLVSKNGSLLLIFLGAVCVLYSILTIIGTMKITKNEKNYHYL